MKLPNAHLAVIEQEKLTEYLLNPAHPDRRDEWEKLADSLRKHAADADVAETMESSHGHKYILDGRIETPSGKMPRARSVWIVDRGFNAPRLVTAYPLEEDT